MSSAEMDELPKQCFEIWGELKKCCSNWFLYNPKTGKYKLDDTKKPQPGEFVKIPRDL